MRLSLCLDPGRPWPHVRALAQRADAAGWHAVYVCDHFMPHDPAGRPRDGPMLECWTTLAALATQTAGIRLGSLVLGSTYRHPAVVASMAATLDQVSRGRAVLGIGAGWQPNEHAAYGIARPAVRDRIDALDQACAAIRALLGQRPPATAGAAGPLPGAPCGPGPAQPRLPLLVGGAGQRTLRVAARHADVWHAWADPAVLARKNAALDRHCRDLGRDPAAIARATGGTVAVRSGRGSDRAAAENDVQGTPAEVLSRLLAFRDAGAGEFIVRDDAAVPAERALTQIDILTEAVLPALMKEIGCA
jgi:alkanesulfonate monooxygenase SsuD/methylene tetrahydromethanopterin reductase-like flavin-dependent oxidoreductase (luciferase family)